MTLILPGQAPKPGYYYHYKHDADSEDMCNYAYRVLGVGAHTEIDGVWFVNYLPLYDSSVVRAGKQLGIIAFDNRPLDLWMSEVTIEGVTRPRFIPVIDEARLAVLTSRFREMYGAAFG